MLGCWGVEVLELELELAGLVFFGCMWDLLRCPCSKVVAKGRMLRARLEVGSCRVFLIELFGFNCEIRGVIIKPSLVKIEKFEDLRCWQSARQLVKLVFLAARTGALAKDFDTKYQLTSAALSSMNNIAEGFGRFGKKDSIKFYDISQSSALEVTSMTYVLSDLNYLTEQQIIEIRLKAGETRNRTLAFIKYLRSTSEKDRCKKSTKNELLPNNQQTTGKAKHG